MKTTTIRAGKSATVDLSTILSSIAASAKEEALGATEEAALPSGRSRACTSKSRERSASGRSSVHKQRESLLSTNSRSDPDALDLQALIKPVIDQIVRVARPDRIILFGSAVTGRMTTDSDLDFLVVVPDQAHPEQVIDRLNMEVRRKPAPCDFLVATRSMLKAHSTRCASIFKTALKDGEEVYAG